MSVTAHTSRAIDVTRGIAALGVIWGHSIYGFSAPLDLNGAFWVWVFLPLSGYLVARSFDDDGYARTIAGAGRFLWNRGLRILPLAELALCLGALIVLASDNPWPANALKQFLLIDHMTTLSGPLWTVTAELHFYLLALLMVPLAIWLYKRGGVVGLVTMWIAALVVARITILYFGDNSSQPRTMPGNLAFFVFGVVLAQPRRLLPLAISVKVTLCIALVGVAWWLQNFRPAYFWAWEVHTTWPHGGAAACALVLTAVVLLTTPFVRLPARATMFSAVTSGFAWCGFHTYSIYVWHSVLATLNNNLLHIPPGPLRLALLLGAVPLAPLSYRYFERPLLRFKKSRADRATVEAARPLAEALP